MTDAEIRALEAEAGHYISRTLTILNATDDEIAGLSLEWFTGQTINDGPLNWQELECFLVNQLSARRRERFDRGEGVKIHVGLSEAKADGFVATIRDHESAPDRVIVIRKPSSPG